MPRRAAGSSVTGFEIRTLKGGRNGFDPPILVPDDQTIESLNADFYTGALGRKRPGSDSVALTGGTPVSAPICAAFRHLPAGTTETAAELWLVDAAGIFHRMAAGTTLQDVTPKDPISAVTATNATQMRGIVFNGKLFLFYANAAGRPAVWDGTSLRRAGVGAPSAAPSSVLAAGAVTDTRFYQSAAIVMVGGVIVRRSEFSPVSGNVTLSSQQTTETFNGAPGEGETNWELYGASTSDNVVHFIGSTTIGNTIVDNNATLTGALAPLVGTNSVIPDAVLCAVDGNSRMLLGRHRTNAQWSSRIWFTPILAVAGDDERVPTILNQNNFFDLSPNDGDFVTAIAGPLQGSMYVWKNHSLWKLTPTGDTTAPYATLKIGDVGCASDKSVVRATDEFGQTCLCWWAQEGPYRIGFQGLQYMGRDIEDYWPRINLTAPIPAHALYHRTIHQIWFWVCIDTNTDPQHLFVFDTILGHAVFYAIGDAPPTAGVRRGWSRFSGNLANARCSVLFAAALGNPMGVLQKPYAGFVQAPTLLRGDSATATSDGGTPFQAYQLTKSYYLGGKMNNFEGSQPIVEAKASSGTTLELQVIPDWGEQPTQKDYVTLTAQNNGARVSRKFEKINVPDCYAVQFQMGDARAVASSWELDELIMPVTETEPR